MEMDRHSQGEVVQTPRAPVTPVIPGALTSLQDMVNQDAHALDEMSRSRLQKRLQKLASAAQISFAERALQKDQVRFLTKLSNETKVRRSIKSLILGKGKNMSFEYLKVARKKRANRQATAGKDKRGRKPKPKNSDPEADLSELRTAVRLMRKL